MAKVKIQGHASGTGVLTVTAPNTSTDRTITLPDATGTLLNSDGDGSSLTGVGVAGISSSADATAITINSGENVGIGDTDPSEAKLSITGVQAGDVGVKIDHDIVDTHALQIASDNTTARGIDVECNALTTGHGAKFYSNSSDTSTRQLVRITNDHVNSTGTTGLYIDNDSTGLVADFHGAGGIRSAGGIKFGADTAAANALNDYEEGTWTPACTAYGSLTVHSAQYTKIGNQVTVQAYVVGSSGNSNGVQLSGLPYNNVNSGWSTGQLNYASSNTNHTNAHVRVEEGTNKVFIMHDQDSNLQGTEISGHIIFTVTYFTNS